MDRNMFRDIPTSDPCNIVNPVLWNHFINCFKKIYSTEPASVWGEDEVVQWLDTRYDYLRAIKLV